MSQLSLPFCVGLLARVTSGVVALFLRQLPSSFSRRFLHERWHREIRSRPQAWKRQSFLPGSLWKEASSSTELLCLHFIHAAMVTLLGNGRLTEDVMSWRSVSALRGLANSAPWNIVIGPKFTPLGGREQWHVTVPYPASFAFRLRNGLQVHYYPRWTFSTCLSAAHGRQKPQLASSNMGYGLVIAEILTSRKRFSPCRL